MIGYKLKTSFDMHPSEPTYNYESVINELSNSQIDISDAYKYINHRLNYDFDIYFRFCQDTLLEISSFSTFNITPSRFYFIDDSEVNAAAFQRENGFFRITVNRGTVEDLHNLFCENNILDDSALKDYKHLNNFLQQSEYPTSLDYVIFNQCLTFIFFHELGHLVQFSKYENMNEERYNINVLKEKNMNGGEAGDVTSHIMELDADKQAAYYLGNIIWSRWSKFPTEEKTYDNLKRLIVVSLVGILSFFIMLIEFPSTGIYYCEGTHPHPLIRIMWIVKNLIDAIAYKEPSIDNENIIEETLRVVNIYFKHKNLGDVHRTYIDPYRQYHTNMGDYLYSLVLIAGNPGYEFLS